MIKISFCIPTYNRANELKRAIKSILCYNLHDIEIIIQDNNSPDHTQEVMAEFSDPRIKYFRNSKSLGPAKNVLSIIERATGEYIYYLTDDDFLFPDTIWKVIEFIDKYNPIAFTSDIITYFEKQKIAINYTYFKETKLIGQNDYDQITKVFLSSHLLTRICFKRNELDYNFMCKFEKNLYPIMLIIGLLSNKGRIGYLAEATGIHSWENQTYWDVDPNEREILNQDMAYIIFSLKDKINFNQFQSIIIGFTKRYLFFDKKLLSILSWNIVFKLKIVCYYKKLYNRLHQIKMKIKKIIFRT